MEWVTNGKNVYGLRKEAKIIAIVTEAENRWLAEIQTDDGLYDNEFSTWEEAKSAIELFFEITGLEVIKVVLETPTV